MPPRQAHYICVYIDKEKSAGQRLAGSFEMSEGSGLVISDHTGKYQAFRYEGELSNNDLERQLRKYADSDRTVNRTVTVLREETRYYPPSQTFTPASTYIPPAAPSPISFGSFGGAAMGRNC